MSGEGNDDNKDKPKSVLVTPPRTAARRFDPRRPARRGAAPRPGRELRRDPQPRGPCGPSAPVRGARGIVGPVCRAGTSQDHRAR